MPWEGPITEKLSYLVVLWKDALVESHEALPPVHSSHHGRIAVILNLQKKGISESDCNRV